MSDVSFAGRRLGSFVLAEELGRGGFATVYRARQLRLDRDVAVKVLDPLLARNSDTARRFDREGSAAAGLDHPNIVPVYEAGNEDGIVYLAMRLVEGDSFADELRDGRPTPERAVTVVRAVADALDHAHSRGVLHRDVKPGNILVEGDRVWLADFGIAATVQTAGAYTLGAIGSLHYMAPEQAQPGPIDGRADLYALGCVAFEAVTGHTPYAGTELAALLYAHAHNPVPKTGDGARDKFFARALAKQPADRFATGDELARAFAAALGVEEVVAVDTRPRRRVIITAALLALTLGVTVTWFLTRREPTHYVAAAARIKGPLHVRDETGTRYLLPAGWSIASYATDGDIRTTTFDDAPNHAAVVMMASAANGRSASQVAAATEEFTCPPTNQHPATVGATRAVRCSFKPVGQAATPANQVNVYYAVAGAHAFVVEVEPGTDGTKLFNFLGSLQLA